MAILTGNIFTDILGIFVAFIAVLIAYYKWSFTYWKRRGVAQPSPSIPFGNASEIFRRQTTFGVHIKSFYHGFKATGKKYFGIYMLSQPIWVPIDPELVKTIMTKDFQHFTDHGNYLNEETEPLSGHLFNLKGLKWKNLRAKLTPTFTSGKMKMMFQTLVDCSAGLVEVMDKSIEQKEVLDIKDIVGRYTTDVIGSCAFGLDCNSLNNPNSEFRKYGKRVFELNTIEAAIRFLSISFPKVLDFFKLPLLDRDVTKFFLNVVNQTVEYRERNNVIRKDFMHLLIQLKNNVNIKDEEHTGQLMESSNGKNEDVGKSLTMNELAAQAFVFFLAGFETSSTTLTFCFYELVANPEIQEKLREEIISTLEKHQGKITYEAIMEMTYMDKCIQETLRKYPPVSVLIRECTKTYQIPDSNVTIDKGILVFVPILAIQHDPEHYPNPEKFDPERFSPENKAKRHPFTWLPFGEGPRACIGLRFGLMQTKVALTILLRNYKFTLNSKTQTPITLSPDSGILSVEGGVWLNAEKVTHK